MVDGEFGTESSWIRESFWFGNVGVRTDVGLVCRWMDGRRTTRWSTLRGSFRSD